MPELQSSNLPPDATPISTEQLFAIIGELFVQVRVLQGMLRQKLGGELDGAVEKRSLQGKDN